MAGWGCPHNVDGECRKVPGKKCDPGMKGCVLFGKFSFSSPAKNISRRLQEKDANKEKSDEK